MTTPMISKHALANEFGIKTLYEETYKNRLKPNEPTDRAKDQIENKMKRFESIIKIASKNKTDPWTKKELIKVLQNLKKGKARDPHGLISDIFKPDVAGENLIDGLLLLYNNIKSQKKIPKIFQYANVTSFYKGKGEKNDMDNERGIFCVTVFRYILDCLIYNREYKNVDKNLSDSNVGARKGRNHRDNLFVLYGIINSAIKGEISDIDVQFFDVVKCFDK